MLMNYGSCVVFIKTTNVTPTTKGNWQYIPSPDQTNEGVILTKYIGNDPNVVIPTQI